MPGTVLGLYGASKLDFNSMKGSSVTAEVIVDLLASADGSDRSKPLPALVVVQADQDVYIVQGGSTVALPTTDANKWVLKANTYWAFLVESANDRYVAVKSKSGTAANFRKARVDAIVSSVVGTGG